MTSEGKHDLPDIATIQRRVAERVESQMAKDIAGGDNELYRRYCRVFNVPPIPDADKKPEGLEADKHPEAGARFSMGYDPGVPGADGSVMFHVKPDPSLPKDTAVAVAANGDRVLIRDLSESQGDKIDAEFWKSNYYDMRKKKEKLEARVKDLERRRGVLEHDYLEAEEGRVNLNRQCESLKDMLTQRDEDIEQLKGDLLWIYQGVTEPWIEERIEKSLNLPKNPRRKIEPRYAEHDDEDMEDDDDGYF